MADHIVVFDGTARLIGHTVRIAVIDASPFTLYGTVLTEEMIGANLDRKVGGEPAAPRRDRFSLPLV